MLRGEVIHKNHNRIKHKLYDILKILLRRVERKGKKVVSIEVDFLVT